MGGLDLEAGVEVWEPDASLVNESFDTWLKDPQLVARSERHRLPTAALRPPQRPSALTPAILRAHHDGHNYLSSLGGEDVAACALVGVDRRVYAVRVGARDPTQPLRKHSSVVPLLGPPPDGHAAPTTVPAALWGGPSLAKADAPASDGTERDGEDVYVVSFGGGDVSVVRKRADGSESWNAVDLAANTAAGVYPLRVEAAALDPARPALLCLLWGVQTFPGDPNKPAHGVLLMLEVALHESTAEAKGLAEVARRLCPPEVAAAACDARAFLVVARTHMPGLPLQDDDPSTSGAAWDAAHQENMMDADENGYRQEALRVPFPLPLDGAGGSAPGAPAAATTAPPAASPAVPTQRWILEANGEAHGMGASWRAGGRGGRHGVCTVGVRSGVHSCLTQLTLAGGAVGARHVATAAAFAHVVAGKPRRKFVALDAAARVCAVVEKERYTTLLELPPVERYLTGGHVVHDARQADGETSEEEVLGARFIQTQEPDPIDGKLSAVTWLVVLHTSSVHLLRLRHYDEHSTEHQAAPDAEGALAGFVWGDDD